MSSEDDDDEELLQRALAQQAQRDQNFIRPAAPALGLAGVPPPPFPAAAVVSALATGSGPPQRNPPRTPPNRAPPPTPVPAMDDDEEESDVELLSISSDDDTPPPTHRKSVQRDVSKVPQVDSESDLEWDGDNQEPENWTNVDQAELVRRVREMREARTVHAVHPVTRLRRTTSIIAAPWVEHLLDPLSLGLINIKTLTLVRDKRDALRNEKASSNENQAFQEEPAVVRDSSLRGSGVSDDFQVSSNSNAQCHLDNIAPSEEKVMYHSENFEPKFFLARIHQNTSSSHLEAGEGALKTDLQNCKDQLKKLVKENFDCFISYIHSKLQQIEDDPEGAGTVHLSNAIHSVDGVAKRAFGPLLERQAQAERIRSVQGMLQRFRTLFNLPSIIRGNISKGNYDLAVRDYKKAKSLVGILSRVLEEVDRIVQEFKEMLYKTMENPNVEN